ncbi:MAG: carboxypeptidase-like regulatory domain-containing protein [Bacteroidales bacterium]|nr:carboxypeptidase-like regulatory domain-containing protein [Bacteroidales bacterium]
MRIYFNLFFLGLFSFSLFSQQNLIIQGKITDFKNSEPLTGASFYIQQLEKGVVADTNGHFKILAKKGKYSIRSSFMGYEDYLQTLNLNRDTFLTIQLKPSAIQLNEAIVQGNKTGHSRSTNSGLIELTSKEIKLLPALMGDHDPCGYFIICPE